MDISRRKKEILRAVVESYIETAEPVGSKTVAQSLKTSVSSATIRNEMAELERLGYLEQPHTSAGRVPSPMGYRLYVNELMREHKLTILETAEINRVLRQKIAQLDALLIEAGRAVSELTHYTAYTLSANTHKATIKRFDFIYVDYNTIIVVAMLDNNTVKNRLMHFPQGIDEFFIKKLATVFNASFTGLTEKEIDDKLISSTERGINDINGIVAAFAGFAINALSQTEPQKPFLSGTSNILTHPEYQDLGKAQKLLTYLSDGEELLKLPAPDDGIKITIGPENTADELKDSSVVVASYDLGNDIQGLLGVVGPTRMDYARVTARLDYISKGLQFLVSGGDLSPPGSGQGSGGKDEQ